MKNEVRDILPRIMMYGFRIFRINPRKAVFKSFRGIEFGDNPRAIYDELYKRRPDYKYVWITQDMNEKVPGAIMVRHGSIREVYELATARLWVDNKRKGCWMSKRKGQLYVQTWHGGVSLKKVEKDAEESLPKYYIKSAIHDSAMADAMTSSSKWQNAQYRNAFWFKNTILDYGLPRNDILYHDHTELKRKIQQHYNLAEDAKILLYAPTFRVDYRTDVYDVDYQALLETLTNKYGGQWYVIVRLHPNIADKKDVIKYTDHVLNGTSYPITNELVVASDILMTDYSSCMFDAMEAGKNVILYALDKDSYIDDRGFYFDLKDLPFPMAENKKELIDVIQNFNDDLYTDKVSEFRERVGMFDEGRASERTVDYILKRIEYKNRGKNR